jgi:hypothetical protein
VADALEHSRLIVSHATCRDGRYPPNYAFGLEAAELMIGVALLGFASKDDAA